MKLPLCPICASSLEERAVAPCFDCGHSPSELEEFERGEHEYHVFSIWGHELVLCDFFDADFGSYHPDYFGLPAGPHPDYPLQLIQKVEQPSLAKDFYCPNCKHRLAFLIFLSKVRAKINCDMPPDLRGIEFDWFSLDSEGNIALFATAGEGFYSDSVANNHIQHTAISENILTPHLGTANIWEDYAAIGLYVFDWALPGGPYKKVASPKITANPWLFENISAIHDIPRFPRSFHDTCTISSWP